MRRIKKIIVHCSDSRYGNASMIRDWHIKRGWRDIGYHFVILNGHIDKDTYMSAIDGAISVGRDIREEGAHCFKQNSDSIGICLIGTDSFTEAQFYALERLLHNLMYKHSLAPSEIYGHYEYSNKTCPNFSVEKFVKEMFYK